MKLRKPFIGVFAFLIVLFTMPLGHAAMIMMENIFGKQYIFTVALILGFTGLLLLIFGIINKNENKATFLGLIAGLFVWTGWIEFAYVYYANRFGVEPLIINNEIVTKPEYLIMPSSVGFWAVLMIYYFFNSRTACVFFNWIQKKLKIANTINLKPTKKNTALVIFMELITILWTFYLVLLFAYDNNFLGDRHFVTYIIAFGSLFWSLFLFLKLIKINKIAYAIKYAIPTVIIFWNFIEILGRWNIFEEIWTEPMKYWIEMLIILLIFIILTGIILFRKKNIKLKHEIVKTNE